MIHHKDYLLVNILEGASDFVIVPGDDEAPPLMEFDMQNLDEESGFYGEWETHERELPPGPWQLIGLASKLTEEQWREMDETLRLKLHTIDPKTTVILKLIKP